LGHHPRAVFIHGEIDSGSGHVPEFDRVKHPHARILRRGLIEMRVAYHHAIIPVGHMCERLDSLARGLGAIGIMLNVDSTQQLVKKGNGNVLFNDHLPPAAAACAGKDWTSPIYFFRRAIRKGPPAPSPTRTQERGEKKTPP